MSICNFNDWLVRHGQVNNTSYASFEKKITTENVMVVSEVELCAGTTPGAEKWSLEKTHTKKNGL